MDLQKIILIGHLGKPPEMRYTDAGKAVTNFSLATNRGVGDNKATDWWNIECWEKTAENAHQFLTKGSKIYCEGTPKWDEWTNKEGENQRTLKITIFTFIMLDKKEDGEGAPTPTDPARNVPQNVTATAPAGLPGWG